MLTLTEVKSTKYRLQNQIELKDKKILEKKLEPFGLSIGQAVNIFIARLKHDDAVMPRLLSSNEPVEYISDSYAKYLDMVQDEAEALDKKGKLYVAKSGKELIEQLENERD